MSNIQVSGNIYMSVKDNYDNYNISIKPNLWCRFETGALTTNNGTDTITITNNGATNAPFSVRGNNSLSLNGTSQYLSGTINGIANNSFSVSAWLYSKSGAINSEMVLNLGSANVTSQGLGLGFGINTANVYYFGFFGDDTTSSSTFVNDINNWVHITWVFNTNTRERMIYRNGIKLSLSKLTADAQPNQLLILK